MKKLRLGVLGCAGIYAGAVAPALKSSLLVEPYAVASRNTEKAQKYAAAHGFAVSYGSYEALLADSNVDFVYIPLPNHLHLEYIKKAADAGKPVICEKPLCLNAKEAAEAASYCKKKEIPLMEAFMYRFHPQWVQAKKLVQSGKLGELIAVNGLFSYFNKDGANIRNIATYGGGALMDIGCYAVSSARYLMGTEPVRVISALTRDPSFKTDAMVSAILDFSEGKTAVFSVSTQMSPYQRVTAIGTEGSFSIEIPFNMPADAPGHIMLADCDGKRLVETELANQYRLEFDSFAESVIQKAEVPTSITDAVANMAVLDALFKSAVSGAWETVQKY